MSKYPKHDSTPTCPGCKARTDEAHPVLQVWFWKMVKPKYPEAHVSWGYRDKPSQDQAFKDGKTKAQWPKSPHNNHEVDPRTGIVLPQALALDLFQITEKSPNGKWDGTWCAKVWDEAVAARVPITWGGTFKSLKDYDHFQCSEFQLKGTVWVPV